MCVRHFSQLAKYLRIEDVERGGLVNDLRKDCRLAPVVTNVAIAVAAFLSTVLGSARVVQAAPPNDACSLLTSAKVSEALGVSVGSGKETVPGVSRSCTWSGPGDAITGKSVRLEILGPLGSMTPVDRFEKNVKMPVDPLKRTPLSGVGDDAVYLGGGRGIPVRLYVRKGSSVIHVVVTGFSTDDETMKLEKTLAQDALTKL